eukprot:2867964-Alexandrium_andersonii.AAC.1
MKRRASALKKVKRIQVLRKAGGRTGVAGRVWRASGIPQAAYACSVFGATQSEVQRLRRVQGCTIDGGKRGRCLTTLVALKGEHADPWITIIRRQVLEWLRLWISTPGIRPLAAKAWEPIRSVLVSAQPNRRWRLVHGPISALIDLLLTLGWEPAE